jgi:hypothetical protein
MCGCMKNKSVKMNMNVNIPNSPIVRMNKPRSNPQQMNQFIFLHNQRIDILKKNIKNVKDPKIFQKIKNMKKLKFF